MTFGIVLLAAGGSSRMGSPKALLPYREGTLVEAAVATARNSGAAEIVVVLGADADAIRARLPETGVRLVRNEGWAEGMGASIRSGVAALSDEIDGVVILLGDQPHVTPAHVRALVEGLAGAPIVASSYGGVLGAPCAFARAEFDRLRGLRGDVGARALVRSGEEPVATIGFDAANVDVDTPEAYRRLLESEMESPTGSTPR